MQTEIRPLEPGDSLRHRELMEQAFSQGSIVSEPEPDAPPPNMANRWGLFANGELQAALKVRPFQTYWGAETVLPLGGIAGVATWAQARGNGYVGELLTESLRVMRDRGEVVSALFPFSFGFYRKYGWDWVGQEHKVTLPLEAFRAFPEGRNLRDITERDGAAVRPKLEAAYTNFARNYRGLFTPETHDWEQSLGHGSGRTTYVYRYEPTGEYFLWRFDKKNAQGRVFNGTMRSPESFRALSSLLHYFGAQCHTAVISVSGDSFLFAHVMHEEMKIKTQPVFMGRVVDLAGAMRALPPVSNVPNGSLTLAVRDEYAPWNTATWRVGVENGTAFCDKAEGVTSSPDVAIDIQTLSQAFWGTPSLGWLRDAGRIDHVGDETAWTLLSRLLPAHPVFTMDDF